jgi:RecB family exonuclease
LEDLRSAHRRHDDRPCRIGELAARIRRWIESRTFSPRTGSSGVHLVDAHAARFGDFDEVHLVGLVEGEWPERPARNIFYPSSLLTQLGWPAEAARMAGERALLADLLRLPRASLSLSSFTLEDDALVEPSTLLEDVQPAAFDVRRDVLEAGAGTPGDIDTVARPAAEPRESADTIWRTLRVSRTSPADPRFHGTTAPAPLRRYAVRAVEDYLDCPFKFFAAHVLGLDGEPGSEEGLDPKARGLLLHGVLQAFYSEWQQSGRGAMTTGDLEEARRLFALVVERHLQALPPSEARLERGRLLGSAVAAGVGDIVFRAEAARETPVVERALEYRLEGSCAIEGGGRARRVELRGVADRIDLLEDGTLRLIDYKLGKAPSRGRAIQLPIYALHAEQQLDGHAGRRWTISEAAYLAFGERDPYVALIDRPADRTAVLADGQARLLDAVEGIEAGQFPPRPAEAYLCARCPFSAVCRKDYVDAD